MLYEIIYYLWVILQLTIGYNLVIPIALFFCYQLSTFSPQHNSCSNLVRPLEADYAIIVTAFEHTENIISLVTSILSLNYSNFVVYVVADKCDISDLSFEDERIKILKPETILASNTRSHFYAIEKFIRPHERITILDSDNLVHPDYLNELNDFFDQQFLAVQGLRAAKNLNTVYARLDAARDLYYHFYDGKILFEIGSSATLAGSGMAFTTSLYKECLGSVDISGAGFDKVLQFQIISRHHRIAFAEKAVVYDQKTAESAELVRQRSRWINTWFRYFSYGFTLLGQGVKNFNLNQFLFGLILVRPPLFIFLSLSLGFLAINLWTNLLAALFWLGALFAFILGFALALIRNGTERSIYLSLLSTPKFIFFQIISLLKVRKANERSLTTKHKFIPNRESAGVSKNKIKK